MEDKLLKLRIVGTSEISAPFLYTESHTTLLKLNNKVVFAEKLANIFLAILVWRSECRHTTERRSSVRKFGTLHSGLRPSINNKSYYARF